MARRGWLRRWDERNQVWAERRGAPRAGPASWPVTGGLCALLAGVLILGRGGRDGTQMSLTAAAVVAALTVALLLVARVHAGYRHRRRR